MALKKKMDSLPQETLQLLQSAYNEGFPFEARFALDDFLSSYNWQELDPGNLAHITYIEQFLHMVCAQLESMIMTESHPLLKLKLREALHFAQSKTNTPVSFMIILKRNIEHEERLLVQAEGNLMATQNAQEMAQQIKLTIEMLKKKTVDIEELYFSIQMRQEKLAIDIQEVHNVQAQYSQLSAKGVTHQQEYNNLEKQKLKLDLAVRGSIKEITEEKARLIDLLCSLMDEIEEMQKNIVEVQITKWKRNQQLSANGMPFYNNLDQIQEWCEQLALIIWKNRNILKNLENSNKRLPYMITPQMSEKVAIISNQITRLLTALVTSTFILEKQPPQVMKTNTRFISTIRLLVGGVLNVHMTNPQVKVTIISENQAVSLIKNDLNGSMFFSSPSSNSESSGDIINNTGTMEYHQTTRNLSVTFRNMQLRKIKRAEKKGTESVMDEKFALLFQSNFTIGNGELAFQVWTLSLPVVVIVHGNQEPSAWATITWDNAFSEPGRIPFIVQEKVKWSQMAEVLNTKFQSLMGRELTNDNIRFLASKVFRDPNIQEASNLTLTWSQFCKEPLHERNFTFWDWFYAIMKITRDYLRTLWADGLIMGFVGRNQAHELLRNKCNGTFLIRFSDSEIGGVTIAWVGQTIPDCPEVFLLQPFTHKDFNIRTLADRISDFKNLVYLYPDVPKDKAFGQHYSKVDTVNNLNGYVKPLLVNLIPGIPSIDSNPSTPQTMQPSSPDQAYQGSIADQDQNDLALDLGVSGFDLMNDMDISAFGMDFMASTNQMK